MSHPVIRLVGSVAPAVRRLLEELNGFVGPRVLRRWQAMALRTGALDVACPLDGAILRCDATLWLEHRLFAYRFRHGAMTMWLMTHGCKTGWRLCGLALLPLGMVFALDEDEDAVLAAHHMAAIATLPASDAPVPGGGGVQIVAGHPNFAHHLWNELPALAVAASEAMPAEAPPLLLLGEPILPLEKLVDWPGPVHRSSEARERPAEPCLLPGLRLPLGSTRIPSALADRVRTACLAEAKLPAARAGAAALSLGLRSMYRHPVNQVDYALALLARLPASVDVYLDGFSQPWDIAVPGRHDAAAYRAWQEETAALAQAVIAAAPPDGPRLVDATRLDVGAAVALGARLSAHVAPHGTQQHKFGWLWPMPGVVHTSPHVAQSDQAAWVADQCEAPCRLTYLPPDMVETVPGTGPFAGNPWYDNYRFVDATAAATYTARALAPFLPG